MEMRGKRGLQEIEKGKTFRQGRKKGKRKTCKIKKLNNKKKIEKLKNYTISLYFLSYFEKSLGGGKDFSKEVENSLE